MKIARFSGFQLLSHGFYFLTLCWALNLCQNLWAITNAVVTAEEAIIYSDDKMSSPLGYVKRGKRIKVGDSARNLGQVRPIIVSGKMAFIRNADINTETDHADPSRFVSERFLKQAKQQHYQASVSLAYTSFVSQVGSVATGNGLRSNDPLTWNGVTLKAEVMATQRTEFQFISSFFKAEDGNEQFQMVEVGFGGAYRILDLHRLIIKLELQGMAIPFSSYAWGSYFRVNGHGGTLGGGVSAALRLGENWGVEAFGGPYYTIISGLNVPSPARQISPSFFGTRIGLGVNYRY
jgi:hypothetical protein